MSLSPGTAATSPTAPKPDPEAAKLEQAKREAYRLAVDNFCKEAAAAFKFWIEIPDSGIPPKKGPRAVLSSDRDLADMLKKDTVYEIQNVEIEGKKLRVRVDPAGNMTALISTSNADAAIRAYKAIMFGFAYGFGVKRMVLSFPEVRPEQINLKIVEALLDEAMRLHAGLRLDDAIWKRIAMCTDQELVTRIIEKEGRLKQQLQRDADTYAYETQAAQKHLSENLEKASTDFNTAGDKLKTAIADPAKTEDEIKAEIEAVKETKKEIVKRIEAIETELKTHPPFNKQVYADYREALEKAQANVAKLDALLKTGGSLETYSATKSADLKKASEELQKDFIEVKTKAEKLQTKVVTELSPAEEKVDKKLTELHEKIETLKTKAAELEALPAVPAGTPDPLRDAKLVEIKTALDEVTAAKDSIKNSIADADRLSDKKDELAAETIERDVKPRFEADVAILKTFTDPGKILDPTKYTAPADVEIKNKVTQLQTAMQELPKDMDALYTKQMDARGVLKPGGSASP